MTPMPIVTLITDFGACDYYVGALKGVILGIARDVRIVDVTHEVQRHNVLHGAFVLRQIWPFYPLGTIHLAVVDPGVGSERRILLGQYAGQYVIAPDNGLVTLLHRDFRLEAMYVVENRRYFASELSATFQARDIMAPVAAHLANGIRPREFGGVTNRIEMVPVSHCAEATQGTLRGRVLYVDRFGTLVTNVREEQLLGRHQSERTWQVTVNGTPIGPIRSTFAEVALGEPVALIGSCGLLEIALNQGNAAERFGPPDAVSVEVR